MINYVKGDAVEANACDGTKIIAHIVNDYGGWGRGFVIPLGRKYPLARESYREWAATDELMLGAVQFVQVQKNTLSLFDSSISPSSIWVANMCAQLGNSTPEYVAVQYDAVADSLDGVNSFAKELGATIHMPRIGCGLGGGDWNFIEEIINEHVDVDTYVYDL